MTLLRVLLVVTLTTPAVSYAEDDAIIGVAPKPQTAPANDPKAREAARQWLRYAAKQAAADPPAADPPAAAVVVAGEDAGPTFGVLDLIGAAQAKLGDTAGAAATAQQLLAAARKTRDPARANVYHLGAASLLIGAGQLVRARALLDEVEADSKPRKPAAPGVATAHDPLETWALGHAAIQRARMGDLPRAHADVEAIPIHADRAFAWADLGRALFLLERPAEAEQAIARAREAGEKLEEWAQAQTCVHVCWAYLDAGRFKQGWEAAEAAREPGRRLQAMTSVLREQGKTKQTEASRLTARKIRARLDAEVTDDEKHVLEYLALARTQWGAGDPVGALETLDEVGPFAAQLGPARRRQLHRLRAAAHIRATGLSAAANADLRKAEAIVLADKDPHLNSDLDILEEALAHAGEFDLAKDLIDRSGSEWLRLLLAEALADRGRVEEAIAVLAKIEGDLTREWAVRRIAAGWASRAGRKGLNKWIAALPRPKERAYAALGAADGLTGTKTEHEFLQSPQLPPTGWAPQP